MGRIDDARNVLEMLRERQQREPDQSLEIDFAIVHAGLHELDQAFDFMEAAARKRLAEVLFSVNSATWKQLRRDPRYWALIERHGLLHVARDKPGG